MKNAEMQIPWIGCFLVAAIFCCQGQVIHTGSGNPLFGGADPDNTVAEGQYWVYPTTDPGQRDKPEFYAYSSPDLQTWTKHGPVLTGKDIAWMNDNHAPYHYLWAPGIFQSGGKIYLYYALASSDGQPAHIGVAISSKPEGPFVDSGRQLVAGDHDFEAIDPMTFRDPKTQKVYLYAGGSANSRLRVYELNPDLVSVAREIPVENPTNFTEGAYMHERNGIYYMSYSHGHWNDRSYDVQYCTAPTPTGPWTYRGIILQSDATRWGPGHHSFLHSPVTGQWYIVYHRWDSVKNGVMPPNRSVCIDFLNYNADGTIQPVAMTDTGVPATPLR